MDGETAGTDESAILVVHSMHLGPFPASYYRDEVRPYLWTFLVSGPIIVGMGIGLLITVTWFRAYPMPYEGVFFGGGTVTAALGVFLTLKGGLGFEAPPEIARFSREGFALESAVGRIPIVEWTDRRAGVHILDRRALTGLSEETAPCIVEARGKSYGVPAPVCEELVERSRALGLRVTSRTRSGVWGTYTETWIGAAK